MKLFECKNLNLGYENTTVVRNLNFFVNDGDYLCVVGENGSGKTTLLKTLLGLNPVLKGEIITNDSFDFSKIGYLPQTTAIQKDFPASVLEIVLSGFIGKNGFFSFYKKAQKIKAREIMKELGISHLEKSSYMKLSGGQQRRVLLARALCAAEKLLILDEPVSNLDPSATQDMYHIIDKLNHEGMTIIMISHDTNAVEKYAKTVLSIGKNKHYFGSNTEYLKWKDGSND